MAKVPQGESDELSQHRRVKDDGNIHWAVTDSSQNPKKLLVTYMITIDTRQFWLREERWRPEAGVSPSLSSPDSCLVVSNKLLDFLLASSTWCILFALYQFNLLCACQYERFKYLSSAACQMQETYRFDNSHLIQSNMLTIRL